MEVLQRFDGGHRRGLFEMIDFLRRNRVWVAITAVVLAIVVLPLFSYRLSSPGSDPESELDRIQKRGDAVEGLPVGKIVLLAPKEMRVGESRQVDANVGINVPIEILRNQLRSGDQTKEDTVHLSANMIATLWGPTFTITPLTPEQQTIADRHPTSWSWKVEATEAGDQVLEATLYALLPDGAKSVAEPDVVKTARQAVGSSHQYVTVSVRSRTFGDWLESFGHQFDIVKTIVVAFFGLATVAAGWFGISLGWRKKKTTPARAEKAAPARKKRPRPTVIK